MKQSFIILFLLITIEVMAPTERFKPLLRPEPINPYLSLYNATCIVESSHRAKVINEKEKAYGLTQCRQMKLDDYNKETGNNYILPDCLNPDISKKIWMHFASKYDHRDYERIAKEWNRSKTDIYWNKIKSNL